MKKNKSFFYIYLIAIALFYALTIGFVGASVKAPQTCYSTVRVEMSNGVNVTATNAGNVTLNIQNGISRGINKIYAYVGEIRSYKTSDDGENYVNLVFDFKYQSDRYSESDTTYAKRIGNGDDERITLTHGSGGYCWKLIYDGGESTLNYDRVRVFTVDEMDIYEVAFIDKDGKPLNTSFYTSSSLNGENGHENICDEQNSFSDSLSKSHNFTDKELEEIAAIRTVMRNSGETFSSGILNAEINALSVSVFGLNTFGLRFPSFLAGFAILIGVYLLTDLLFSNELLAVFAGVLTLCAGNVFSASLTAYNALSACFVFYAFYFAIKFFVCDYYVEDKRKAMIDFGLEGLFFALAIAVNSSNLTVLLGLASIFVFAAARGYKKYRADEKQAKGLGKETVYVAYRGKKILLAVGFVVSFVLLPTFAVGLSYAFVGNALKEMYSANFFNSSLKYIFSKFGFPAEIIPVKALIGFGSENLGNGYYAFANYFAFALSVISLVFVLVLVIFKNKNRKIAELLNRSANKLKLLFTAFIATFLTMTFGAGYTVTDFTVVSPFYSLIVVLAVSFATELFGEKIRKIAFVALCVSVASFAMNYVGFTGIAISETAKAILYGWQL